MRSKGKQLFFCTVATVLWCLFMLVMINEYETANIVGVLAGAVVVYIILLFLVKKTHLFVKRKWK